MLHKPILKRNFTFYFEHLFPRVKIRGYEIGRRYFPTVKTIGYEIGRRYFPTVKTIGYEIGRRYATSKYL